MIPTDPRDEDWNHLADWYAACARDLPWRRRAGDPYAILVSEFMLQQTRVETVLSYYEPFLERFPDLESLAAADLEEVLAAWSGLGYYRRARNLHGAAVAMVEGHGARVPDDPAALRSLPGIGDYTAGAILSIAHGLRHPVLDGNVIRVLSRHEAVEGDPKRAAVRRTLRDLAASILEDRDPSILNQALMELGARICLPERAACHDCPIAPGCRARRQDRVSHFPETAPPPETIEVRRAVAIIRRGSRYLLARNEGTRRLDGFVLFPGIDLDEVDDGPRQLSRHLADHHGLQIEVGPPLGQVRHSITHHRYTCLAFPARPLGRVRTAGTSLTWLSPTELASEAVPAQTRKILALLEGSDSGLDI